MLMLAIVLPAASRGHKFDARASNVVFRVETRVGSRVDHVLHVVAQLSELGISAEPGTKAWAKKELLLADDCHGVVPAW